MKEAEQYILFETGDITEVYRVPRRPKGNFHLLYPADCLYASADLGEVLKFIDVINDEKLPVSRTFSNDCMPARAKVQ